MRFDKYMITFALLIFALSKHLHAHPHHIRTSAEAQQHQLFVRTGRALLEGCANSQRHRTLQEQAVIRRSELVETLRKQRQLAASDVLAKSHKSALTGVSNTTDPKVLFGTTSQCILEPEATQGPYYVSGELIRNDVRETQPGVDLYAELQVIDINTCDPVPDLYVDFWHCNATGVYAGVVANGNGDSTDASNVNKTFHRGLAPTDADGIVSFISKFPGHYTGRATHIHILGSKGGTALSNNTYAGSSASHVGQLFFDQDLITQVEATSAYAANTQTATLNSADRIFQGEAATAFDPVMSYVLLGDTIEDGILAWISVGIDLTVSKSVTAAATLTATGGVMSSGTTSGGPMGGRPGSGPPSPLSATTNVTNTTSTPATSSSAPAFASCMLAASCILAAFALLL